MSGPTQNASSDRPPNVERAGAGRRGRQWFIWALPVLLAALAYVGWRSLGGPPAAVRPIRADIHNTELAKLIEDHIQRVEEAPDDAEEHGQLGLVYEANNLWVEAGQCFANAAALNPDNPTWPHHQALVHWQNGNMDAAVALLQENTTRHPDFAPGLHRLGYAQLHQGRLDAASQSFERFIQRIPDQPHGYVGLAEVRIKQQQYADAVDLLHKALAMSGESKTAHYLLGQAYRALGKLDQAKEELTLGLDAQVEYWPDIESANLGQYARGFAAKLAVGRQLIAAGQVLQAVQVFERLLKDHPDDTRVMNNLAYSYNLMGKFSDSLELLKRAETLDDNAMTRMNLSATLLALNRAPEALESALQGVQLAPTLGDAHVALARVYIAQQQFAEAQSALETALRFAGRNAQSHALLGGVYRKLGRFDLAKQHLKRASETMTTSPGVFGELFESCLETGDLDEAASALERLGQLLPGHPLLQELADKLQARREAR
ncbi:MAG: tetratricopeptide repeat protein [Phycisphaerae bacterium]